MIFRERAIIAVVLSISLILIFWFAQWIGNKSIMQEFNHYHTQYEWLSWKIYVKAKEETSKKNIPLPWMLAIYHSESRGNRFAVSVAGAVGLGQVMPLHWKGRVDALYDVDLNIELSTDVFSNCLIMNKGNLIKALNCYERGNNRQDINLKYLSEIIQNIYFYEETK